jgi:hypothetical protein
VRREEPHRVPNIEFERLGAPDGEVLQIVRCLRSELWRAVWPGCSHLGSKCYSRVNKLTQEEEEKEKLKILKSGAPTPMGGLQKRSPTITCGDYPRQAALCPMRSLRREHSSQVLVSEERERREGGRKEGRKGGREGRKEGRREKKRKLTGKAEASGPLEWAIED